MRNLLNFDRYRAAHALCGAVLLAALAPGVASAGDRAGALQCRLSGNNLTIIVENQALDCVFQDDDERAAPVHYVGKLTKIGANLTVNGPGEVMWLVAAATGHVGPGALAGDYAGPGTTVKAGLGGGGALLVGGNNNTISLQPLEVEAGSGLGVTAGIQSLTLAYVPDQPPPRFRRHHLITK
ncbi:MAG: DUF992 domain-containing protein [Methylocystis sp.]